MHYYEVLVASQTYHGTEALTYSSESALETGTLVQVNLRARPVLAIVMRSVPKPSFDVKPISRALPLPPLPPQQLELMDWLYQYYPAPLGSVVRLFVPASSASERPKKSAAIATNPPANTEPLPDLTAEQQHAIKIINGPGTFLLHGITGSGKSRVYAELATKALRSGKSAMVLTPEIGLTAQLTQSFRQVFGQHVYVLHSQLTAAERRDIYYALLRDTQPSIVIGPRSALFSPLRNVGLIVLDEAHDSAYKNESAPHYRSGRVAAKLAGLHDATLVLGSATPSVEDYYVARAKHRPIITMNALAKTSDTALHIETVDMRRPELFIRNRLLSDNLIARISDAIQRGEQSLVFLNRRGTANVVLCSTCGWLSLCPHCDLSLTYHGDEHELRCHVCGFKSPLPTVCPVCAGTEILFKSIGTKAVAEALQKVFPAARVQRFDTDAKKADRLEKHLSELAGGSVDIIVGTQMVGKGLDLPKLSVVGIVQADSSLLIPDYTATEQTYQLLAQVVGRVGRGHRPGTVIVQTHDPENTTLQAAIHRDWSDFYDAELLERKSFQFPPFVYLLKLRVLRASSTSAEQAAGKLAATLAQKFPGLKIDGPTPSFHPRERGKYSWQILLKSPRRDVLLRIIHDLPSGWSYDIDPINLL